MHFFISKRCIFIRKDLRKIFIEQCYQTPSSVNSQVYLSPVPDSISVLPYVGTIFFLDLVMIFVYTIPISIMNIFSDCC